MGKLSASALRRLCVNGIVSTMDYWKFSKLKKRKNLRPNYSRKPFSFLKIQDDESLLWFRFRKLEIVQLMDGLKVPKMCRLPHIGKFSGLEGLCITLRRLSYPNRLVDLVPMFNRDPGTISKIFNWMIGMLYSRFLPLVSKLNQRYLTREKLEEFAECSSMSGCLYPNIVGYIDGTAISVCRPKYNQRDMYSGYKKDHVLKYQSVMLPNGLIGRLNGPFKGRRHDSAILHLSGLLREVKTYFKNQDGSWMALYGDSGYSNQKFIKVGFKNYKRLTDRQKSFNAVMSSLRVSVEYGFGKLLQQFAFLDFPKNQKIYLQPLKKIYVVSAILVNCQTCIRGGNQVSELFDCKPPTLNEYLG